MHVLTIAPKPEHQGWSRGPAVPVKVYPSSVTADDGGPLLSVAIRVPAGAVGVTGMRMDRAQAIALRDAIHGWIADGTIEGGRS